MDLSCPAFHLVDENQFKETLWHADMLVSLKECVSAHKEDVLSVVQLMLRACAKGFEKQREDIFGFGDYDKKSPNLLSNHYMRRSFMLKSAQ